MENDVRVVTRMPKWLLRLIEEMAQEDRRSTAAMTRVLLIEAIEARKGQPA